MYNTILAARTPDSDGDYPYYSTYSPSATKVYYQKKWPCCSGTLVQTVADYVLNIYFKAVDGIYLNLYTPSRVKWLQAGIPTTLTQDSGFPASDRVVIHVNPASPAEFSIQFRIPAWAASASVTINGRRQSIALKPGTIGSLKRVWNAGDTVELMLPQTFRTEAIDELHPNTVAIMRGPVEYVGLNTFGDKPNQLGRTRPRLRGNLKAIAPQAFTADGTTFVPLYSVQSETYDTYFEA